MTTRNGVHCLKVLLCLCSSKGFTMTYYDHEIARVGNIPAALKLQNEQGQTRWMTIKPEQIKAILQILNEEA